MKKLIWIVVCVAGLFFCANNAFAMTDPVSAAGGVDILTLPPSDDEPVFEGTVTRVISGDLIEIDGERMNLVGIRAPRRWWWGERRDCFSSEVANYVSDLVLGKVVRYQFDRVERLRDPKGTPLVYLFAGDLLLNADLVSKGFVLAERKHPYKLVDDFIKLENEANFYQRGIWHTCPVECRADKICKVKNWQPTRIKASIP